jgi:hypothetical protein
VVVRYKGQPTVEITLKQHTADGPNGDQLGALGTYGVVVLDLHHIDRQSRSKLTVNEQFHWFPAERREPTELARADLRKLFPTRVPIKIQCAGPCEPLAERQRWPSGYAMEGEMPATHEREGSCETLGNVRAGGYHTRALSVVRDPGGALPLSVLRFVERRLDGVDQLEILLFLHHDRAHYRDAAAVARALQFSERVAEKGLEALAGQGLLDVRLGAAVVYRFNPTTPALTAAVDELVEAYRHRRDLVLAVLVRPRRRSLQDFSDAFKFTKDPEDG